MSIEIYKDKAGEFRWRLKTTGQKIVADSGEGYKTKASCQVGIDSVKKIVSTAKTVDLTTK